MTQTILQNVRLIDASCPSGHRANQTLSVKNRLIDWVGPAEDFVPGSASASAEWIDCECMLLAPGLVNAHTHSQSSTLAGFGDNLSHPAFMWRTQAFTSNRTPDEIRLAVMLTAYAALSSGTTALIDHFPGQQFDKRDLDAVLRAWEETGMRATLAVRFFDGEFDDIIPPAFAGDPVFTDAARKLLRPQSIESAKELIGDAVSEWHGKAGRISVFPAPSNPDRCSDAALLYCAEIAERHDTGIHTHLLETKRQKQIAAKRYGVSTVRHLQDLGILSDRWSCAHSIWLDEADIEMMATCGATAVLNPESNARLGTGTSPIPMLRQAGVNLALGTDGAGSNDNMVLHEAMRAICTMHRSQEPDRSNWLTARTALEVATTGGARAIRCKGLGDLRPGAPADLVLYRLDAPWWMPINDAVAQLVFAETGASVDTVMVAGEILFSKGKPVRFDVRDLQREIEMMTASLRARNSKLVQAADGVVANT